MVQFNRTHSFLNLQAKFFDYVKQNSLNSPTYSVNDAKFASIIDPFTLCFRCLPWQRTLRNSRELCKFCAIRSHSPRMMQNSHHLLTHYIVCFRCLTSGRELPKIPANQAKFAQFTHTSRELYELHAFHTKIHPHLVHYFQTSDHRQRTLENWSESTRFCAVHPQLLQITRNSLNPHPWPTT